MNLASAATPPVASIARLRAAPIGSKVSMDVSLNYALNESQTYSPIGNLGLPMTFGDRLKKARLANDLKQDQVAEFFVPKVDRVAVSNWENGRGMPQADKLKILCRRLGVSADYLLGLVPDNKACAALPQDAMEVAQKWSDLPAFLAHTIKKRLDNTHAYSQQLSPLFREKVFGRIPQGEEYRALEAEFVRGMKELLSVKPEGAQNDIRRFTAEENCRREGPPDPMPARAPAKSTKRHT